MILRYLLIQRNYISVGRKCHDFFKKCEISFKIEIKNLILLNYVFFRPSITYVICLSNNIIIFTKTILEITKKFVEKFLLKATVQGCEN